MAYRIRVDYDPEPIDFGGLMPDNHEEYERVGPFSDHFGAMSFDQWKTSYEADPDHYVAYGVIVEQWCDLGDWHEVPTLEASLWGIVFLDNDPDRPRPGVYDSPDDLSGYIAAVARECWYAATSAQEAAL